MAVGRLGIEGGLGRCGQPWAGAGKCGQPWAGAGNHGQVGATGKRKVRLCIGGSITDIGRNLFLT